MLSVWSPPRDLQTKQKEDVAMFLPLLTTPLPGMSQMAKRPLIYSSPFLERLDIFIAACQNITTVFRPFKVINVITFALYDRWLHLPGSQRAKTCSANNHHSVFYPKADVNRSSRPGRSWCCLFLQSVWVPAERTIKLSLLADRQHHRTYLALSFFPTRMRVRLCWHIQ